jgi:hypothetical protein
MNTTIKLAALGKVVEGEIIETSPHGTFTVIRLSNRVTIVSISKDSQDEEHPDYDYITYVGVRSQIEQDFYRDWAIQNGGCFRPTESFARRSKRVKSYPKEMKIRGLDMLAIIKLVKG